MAKSGEFVQHVMWTVYHSDEVKIAGVPSIDVVRLIRNIDKRLTDCV